MTKPTLVLSSMPPAAAPLTRKGWGKPRFLTDRSAQLDVVSGCPDAVVPKDHLARHVIALVDLLDLSSLEAGYSSLGRRGLHPRHKLGALVYGSLIGIHEASKLARLIKTDAALRLITGGHSISATGLCTFRRENAGFFQYAIEQTVQFAAKLALVDPKDLSVDSMRLRAEASTKSIRTLKRSEERLRELEDVDKSKLDAADLAKHEAKVEKHRTAVERCRTEGRTNHSVTNEAAGLMKFPSGASLPGHRVTVVAAGMRVRFVIAVVIGSEPTDYNLLAPAVRAAQASLRAAGIDGPLQVAADPGYLGHEDLQFALDERANIDVLVHDPPSPRRGKSKREGGFFSKAEFTFEPDGTATCPAGTKMHGPVKAGRGQLRWRGVGCDTCPLKPQCTEVDRREVVVDPERERLHGAMQARMRQDGAQERYRRRIATVEPVFSYIEDTMGYRRASSRHAQTVRAEILLKVLAHNLARILWPPIRRVAVVHGEWDGERITTSAVHVVAPSDLISAWSDATVVLADCYSC